MGFDFLAVFPFLSKVSQFTSIISTIQMRIATERVETIMIVIPWGFGLFPFWDDFLQVISALFCNIVRRECEQVN